MLRKRSLFDAYVDGAIDAVNYGRRDPGVYENGMGSGVLDRVREQGFHDAQNKRVLRFHQFTADEVLRRAEVRELAL